MKRSFAYNMMLTKSTRFDLAKGQVLHWQRFKLIKNMTLMNPNVRFSQTDIVKRTSQVCSRYLENDAVPLQSSLLVGKSTLFL